MVKRIFWTAIAVLLLIAMIWLQPLTVWWFLPGWVAAIILACLLVIGAEKWQAKRGSV